MTVDAFLQMDDSTAPMNTLRYSAFAQLANSSTVVHRVHTSTHSDYIGKTLERDIEFHKDTSKLVLTPREKFLGAAFALVASGPEHTVVVRDAPTGSALHRRGSPTAGHQRQARRQHEGKLVPHSRSSQASADASHGPK